MLAKIAGDNRISSVHATFCTEADWKPLRRARLAAAAGAQQYHWHNAGTGLLRRFLAALASRKRKAIRKEREAVRREGLSVRALAGDEIRPAHWDAFFAFYMDTGGRKWGTPYLTRSFFDILGSTMADKVVLVMAEADGRPVGGALNLKGDDTLYGRDWGCLESHAFLHFEACYYQAIDYAIASRPAAGRSRRAGRSQDPARLACRCPTSLGALDRRPPASAAPSRIT